MILRSIAKLNSQEWIAIAVSFAYPKASLEEREKVPSHHECSGLKAAHVFYCWQIKVGCITFNDGRTTML